ELLDAGLGLLLDVLLLVLHVAPVEHGVLRRADVDERGLHAGQHVLHPAQVDVPVDLGDVVGPAGDVVLDQPATLEGGAVGRRLRHRRAQVVPADRPALALTALAPLEGLAVALDPVAGDLRLAGSRRGARLLAAPTAPPAPTTRLGPGRLSR